MLTPQDTILRRLNYFSLVINKKKAGRIKICIVHTTRTKIAIIFSCCMLYSVNQVSDTVQSQGLNRHDEPVQSSKLKKITNIPLSLFVGQAL